jgi:xanthosine utilization system XapX-like protein
MLKLFLRILAVLVITATILIGTLYAVFMVVWHHAPAPKVLLVTLMLCAVPLAISWGILYLAKRIQSNTPTNN